MSQYAAHYLVADTRERHVHGLLKTVFGERPFAVAQINTGDYLICRRLAGGAPEVLAVIERKTLKDFAASLCDNRYANRHKMLDLRDRTGCQLYFFVEGRAFPKPSARIGRVPYRSILSAMTNLMVRDGIAVVQTADQMHTARRLLEFVAAFEKTPVPFRGPVAAGGRGAPGAEGGGDVPPALTGRVEKATSVLAVEMWSALPGVSAVTAQVVLDRFSARDFASGGVTAEALGALRSPANRPLRKGARRSLGALRRGEKKEQVALLAGVPGVSRAMAAMLLEGRSLRALLEDGAAEAPIRQKGRTVRLGEARAERIRTLMGFSAARPAERPAGQPAEQPAGRPAEQPAGRPAEQPAGARAEQPAEQPAGGGAPPPLTDSEFDSLLSGLV